MKPTPPPPPQKYTCGIFGTPTEGQCLPDPKGLFTFDECPRCRGPATGCSNCDADSPCYDDATGYCHAANDDKSCGAGTQNCLEANGACKTCRDNDFTCYRLDPAKSEGNQLSCKNNTDDFTAYIGPEAAGGDTLAKPLEQIQYSKCPENYNSVYGASCNTGLTSCEICNQLVGSETACIFDENSEKPYCVDIPTNNAGGCNLCGCPGLEGWQENMRQSCQSDPTNPCPLQSGERACGYGCYLCQGDNLEEFPCGISSSEGGFMRWAGRARPSFQITHVDTTISTIVGKNQAKL